MTSVAVMMSVYNGEEYIAEQIDSILSQRGVHVSLHVRDDGSGPMTREILRCYAADHPNVHITFAENLGIKNSFLKLVSDIPDQYDYYAFSDADDVWLPDKLGSAVSVLRAQDQSMAQAYCGQVKLVDENLKFIAYGRPLYRPIVFSNAVVECRMSGATAVFNRRLIQIAKSLDYNRAVMHDAWMNLLAASFGDVHFDPVPRILYRQHGRNADGGKRSITRTWRDRLDRRKLFEHYVTQAQSLSEQAAGRMADAKRAVITRLTRYHNGELSRLQFLLDDDIEYQRRSSKLLTALFI